MQNSFDWVSLADIPLNRKTKTGVRYSQFETENLMMGVLAVCFHHIMPIHYDHFIASLPKSKKLFYFGSKKMIDPHTMIPTQPLNDSETAQIMHRMAKLFDNLSTESIQYFLSSRGILYVEL